MYIRLSSNQNSILDQLIDNSYYVRYVKTYLIPKSDYTGRGQPKFLFVSYFDNLFLLRFVLEWLRSQKQTALFMLETRSDSYELR